MFFTLNKIEQREGDEPVQQGRKQAEKMEDFYLNNFKLEQEVSFLHFPLVGFPFHGFGQLLKGKMVVVSSLVVA